MKLFKSKTDLEEIKLAVNTDNQVKVIFKSGTFKKGDELIPSNYLFAVGVSDITILENKYVVINSEKVLMPEQQELENIRGKVISDYQEQLEKEWIEELHATYVVKLNNAEIESIIK
jgi:peptidyl-prolyl cis-trans isomerase SurA